MWKLSGTSRARPCREEKASTRETTKPTKVTQANNQKTCLDGSTQGGDSTVWPASFRLKEGSLSVEQYAIVIGYQMYSTVLFVKRYQRAKGLLTAWYLNVFSNLCWERDSLCADERI